MNNGERVARVLLGLALLAAAWGATWALAEAKLGTAVSWDVLALTDAELPDPQALSVVEVVHQKQMAALLMQEIARLPPPLREVLLLRDI